MKAYGEVDVWIHVFLTSALAAGDWSASRPGRLTPGEKRQSGRRREPFLDSTGALNFGLSVVQQVASRYIDYATPALNIGIGERIILKWFLKK
jgi:hypothetical protein